MNRLTFFGLLLVSGWLVVAPLAAQQPVVTAEYSYRKFTADDGLVSSYTFFLYQDSKGFIWIGGDAGLSRYDGLTFTNFLTGKYTNIGRINENSKGEVRAFSHLAMFTIDAFADTVRTTYADSDYYTIPLASRDLPSQFGFFKSNQTNNHRDFMEIGDNYFRRIFTNEDVSRFKGYFFPYIDTNKEVIYLPLSDGIKVLSLHTGKRIASYNNVIARCFVMWRDTLCAIAYNGIYRLENNEFKQFVKFNLYGNNVSNLKAITDIDGNLIIMDSQRLYKLVNQRLEVVFNADIIRDMICDKEGNLWVATEKGLYCLFRLQFKNYHTQTENNKITLADIVKEKLLIGTEKGDLFYADNNTNNYPFTNVKIPLVTSLKWDNSTLYISARRDVLQLKGKSTKPLHLPMVPQYENDSYFLINKTPTGNLIAGSDRWLVEFTPAGKVIRVYPYQYLLQPTDGKPCYDSNGNLFICGGEGISKCTPDGKVSLIKNNSVKYSLIMTNDNHQNIWFSGENLLCKIENDSTKIVAQFNGRIRNIYFTKNDILIVATTEGIYLSQNNDFNKFRFYNQGNGYTGKEALSGNIAEDEDGNVYIPSMDALVSFNPQKLFTQPIKPRLHIHSIFISSDNINWHKTDTLHLKLSHTQKNIRFSYIGLSYSQAQNVRYQYRLLGFQNQWSNPVSERQVTFNNLPPAKYTFQLKASAGTEETQTDTISLAFEITPAFWQTWWFWTFSIVALVGCLVWIIYYYLKKKQLENIKRIEREKEMNELRVQSVRLKSIPHFNSNVLASIEYYMMAKSKEESNQLLTRYSRFTNITLHEIDKANRSLKDEIDYVRLYLELEKLRFGDKLSYSIDVDENTDTEIRIPNMVLHTYAENAVKHGIRGKNTPGHVSIKAASEKNGVLLSVEDDGIGREESCRRDPDREGHGLRILTRQIELYNQQNAEKIVQSVIDLKDDEENAAGTRFEMFVPSDYKYL